MISAELAARIKTEAHRLGFDIAGFTSPEKPPHFAFFQDWLSAGYHGTMAYLSDERSLEARANARFLLPECRSILVLGIRYPAPSQLSPTPPVPLSGRVASYAVGEDYHLVLPERLHTLAEFIQSILQRPIRYKCVTDSAPLLERDLAQRAGLGWIGKNTCLIHPALGSFFFLAELLLDLEVPFDPPFEMDYCGTCRRCIDACPTQCILPNRTLDARRCISYLTIELKSEIPSDLQPALGEWVFGCDICQMVCPWNRKAGNATVAPAFMGEARAPWLNLAEILQQNHSSFRERYRRSALQRAKLRGLARNSAVVLGNLAKSYPQELPRVIQLFSAVLNEHPQSLVRLQVIHSLAHLDTPAARQVLLEHLDVEQDEEVLKTLHTILKTGL